MAKILKKIKIIFRKDIDFSDIPEITNWDGWVRGKFYRPKKETK